MVTENIMQNIFTNETFQYVICNDYICTVLLEIPIVNATIAIPTKNE